MERRRRVSFLSLAQNLRRSYMLIYSLIGLVLVGLLIWGAWVVVDEISWYLEKSSLSERQISHGIFVTRMFGLAAAAALTGLFALGLFAIRSLNFRVSTAEIAVRAQLNQMKIGNFGVRRQLRDDDELQSVMSDLHAVCDFVEGKVQPNAAGGHTASRE